MTILQVRELFYTILEDYPSLSYRLPANPSIFHDSAFESGICKIMSNDMNSMTKEEEKKPLFFVLNLRNYPVLN